MVVLDTNALLYFFKGEGHVAANLLAHPPADVAVPSVVVFEIATGIAKSVSPKKRRAQLDKLLEVVTVLPFGFPEALVGGQLRARLEKQGTPIGPMDTLIAATALANGGQLVTRNVREFSRVPDLRVLDWYSTPPPR